MKTLLYYITAHGYGHGARSCDILRAFHRASPETPILIITDLSEPFLRNRMPDIPFALRRAVFDVGMVQLDSVRVDVPETLRRALDVVRRRAELLENEGAFIRSKHAGLVVCDIPSIPLEAAKQADVPRVAIGNFSWNWIYSAFADRDARWHDVMDMFEEGYAKSDLLLRLPFAEKMTAFPCKQDVPLVAEPGTPNRAALAALTGAPMDRCWVLLSFSSLGWDDAALREVEALDRFAFFTVRPLEWNRKNLFAVDRERVSFSDVMASVDVVVTKPGFGVLSECVVNRKPMVYVERTDFLEYSILEQAVHRHLKHQHIPAQDLYRGALGDALRQVLLNPEPRETPGTGGGPIVAEILKSRIRS